MRDDPAAESDGSGELLSIDLAAGLSSAVGIVKPLRLLKILSQIVDPTLVFCLGL